MKTLVAFCALVACCLASPGGLWAGRTGLVGGLVAPEIAAAPGFIASGTIAGPAYAAASPILTTGTAYAAAPAYAVAPAYAAAPAVVAARTIVSPAVATSYSNFIAPRIAAPAVAAAPALVATRTYAAPAVAAVPAIAAAPVVATRTIAAAPVATQIVAAAPAVVTAPATKAQWHAQDEHGQASYGHAEPLQTHTAVQDAHGNKVGSFSYLNPHDGQVHRTDYVADALGYRVTANDVPVAPVALRHKRSIVAPFGLAAAPLSIAATHLAAPLNVAAVPALREAVLTTVVNNPGHAVSYRID